jgi:hypothetical protein
LAIDIVENIIKNILDNIYMEEYKKKYLEYKIKYIQLKKNMENKNQSGGTWFYQNNPRYNDASFYPVHMSLSLSPTFTTNNNINPPTPREINNYLRNFKHTRRFSRYAIDIINRIPLILYAFEEIIRDPDPYDWDEPYLTYYTLHVFYQNNNGAIRDSVIHHKMFQFTYNDIDAEFNTNTQYGYYYDPIYNEEPVFYFDYDTLREYKLPPLEHQPTPI